MTCRECKKDAAVTLASPDGICTPCAQKVNPNYVPSPYHIGYDRELGYAQVLKGKEVIFSSWEHSAAQRVLDEKNFEWAQACKKGQAA
jgi:hypothetical protein